MCQHCRENASKFLYGTVVFNGGRAGEDVVKWLGKFCSLPCKDEFELRNRTTERTTTRSSLEQLKQLVEQMEHAG